MSIYYIVFRVQGSGFKVLGSRFKVQRYKVQRFKVQGSKVLGSRFKDHRFRAAAGQKNGWSNRERN